MKEKLDADGLEAAARIFWESWPHPKITLVFGREAVWRKVPEIVRRQVRVCVLLAVKEYLAAVQKKTARLGDP